VQQGLKHLSSDFQQGHGRSGAHTGSAQATCEEEAHLADEIARASHVEELLLVRTKPLDDFQVALQHNIEAIALISLAKQQNVRGEGLLGQCSGEESDAARRQ